MSASFTLLFVFLFTSPLLLHEYSSELGQFRLISAVEEEAQIGRVAAKRGDDLVALRADLSATLEHLATVQSDYFTAISHAQQLSLQVVGKMYDRRVRREVQAARSAVRALAVQRDVLVHQAQTTLAVLKPIHGIWSSVALTDVGLSLLGTARSLCTSFVTPSPSGGLPTNAASLAALVPLAVTIFLLARLFGGAAVASTAVSLLVCAWYTSLPSILLAYNPNAAVFSLLLSIPPLIVATVWFISWTIRSDKQSSVTDKKKVD